MAGCSKQFDFVFDGGLLSQTRASLVNEVVKYLLYERNQIPLQFDILKQQMTVSEAKNSQVRQRHATPFLLPFHFSFYNYSNIIPYTSLASRIYESGIGTTGWGAFCDADGLSALGQGQR